MAEVDEYIAEEYDKRVKTPLIEISIWKNALGVESLRTPDAYAGIEYKPDVVNCKITYGANQRSGMCTFQVIDAYDEFLNKIDWKPMDRVRVRQGWNKLNTLKTTFYGFIQKITMTDEPGITEVACQDILKLCEMNYYLEENKKVYHITVDADGYGGQPESERTAEVIISTALEESGIPSSRYTLDFPDYGQGLCPIIGNNNPAEFYYMSAIDIIDQICGKTGYRIWADPSGQVRCQLIQNIAISETNLVYKNAGATRNARTWNSEEYAFPIFFDNQSPELYSQGSIIEVSTTVSDDGTRNYIVVEGAEERVVVFGESKFVTTPPEYRRAEIKSDYLDGIDIVTDIATRVYDDLNRLQYTGSVRIEGDSRIEVGRTIKIVDDYSAPGGRNYVVGGYNHNFNGVSWITDIDLAGGLGSEAPAAMYWKPIATFQWYINMVKTDSDYVKVVYVDASGSVSPDGTSLTYLWECDGYSDATTVKNSYTVTNIAQTTLPVTLTVTDIHGTTDTETISISLFNVLPDTPVDITAAVIMAASGSNVYHTKNGGDTWFTSVFPATVTALDADRETNVGVVGLSDGRVYTVPEVGVSTTIVEVYTHTASVWAVAIVPGRGFKQSWEGDTAWFWVASGASLLLHKNVIATGSTNLLTIPAHTFDNIITDINASTFSTGLYSAVVAEGGSVWTNTESNIWNWHLSYAVSGTITDLFVRDTEIQIVWGDNGFARNSEFGTSTDWYTGSSVPTGGNKRVGFNVYDSEDTVLSSGSDLLVYDGQASSGRFNFTTGASLDGAVQSIDTDVYSSFALVGTASGLYVTSDWGKTALKIRNENFSNVAAGFNYTVAIDDEGEINPAPGYDSITVQTASISDYLEIVWAWTGTEWLLYDPDITLRDLVAIEPGWEYWIKVSEGCTLTYTNNSHVLTTGWNPSFGVIGNSFTWVDPMI